uniref:Uncharacterized protein n=1 Tax=Pseudomonas phage Cygsa01 TaxID=3138529 RepID=A0AAU6W3E9_9VIRU
MRPIEILPRVAETNFHGLMLPVLPDEEFLAADPDGSVWAFTTEPKPGALNTWHPANGQARRIGTVDLEGTVWNKTLVEIDPVV